MVRVLCILFFCFLSASAEAQITVTNAIPLKETIDVKLLGYDDALLQCYNLYGFEYNNGQNTFEGEFIILKEVDSLKEIEYTKLKFCRVREFAIKAGTKCRNIPVESGINLRQKNVAEPTYLNFDPLGPEPVFIPCK